MRLFLAINPASDLQLRIEKATSAVRRAAPDLRWIAPDRVHLTMRFLGEVPVDRVPAIGESVDAVVSRHGETPFTLNGIGAFPNFRRARVVWVSVEPHPRLELLHHDVEEACTQMGFEPEGRPFRPHLTIARVPDGTDETTLRALSRAARAVQFAETAEVSSVDLMVSEPAAGGVQYRLLHASSLGTAV